MTAEAWPDASAKGCPVCGGVSLHTFVERTQVPVHQNRVFATRAAARGARRGDLEMQICGDCGFVSNRRFDPGRLEYAQDYDNTQSHSAVFDAYLDQHVAALVERDGVRDAQIVEVGCGKGHFLRKLVAWPGSGNRGIGFDPSYRGPGSALDGRLRFERRFYDAQCAQVPADVVLCRHVIEHVADPLSLLRAVRAALVARPHARVFFETPCVQWILRSRVVWDFFYEHCSLFSAASLRLAFERTGFAVHQVRHVFGGQYLWLEARPAAACSQARPAAGGAAQVRELGAQARQYAESERSQLRAWARALARWSDQGPVALWGAGAKGATFAHLLDPRCERIDCLVDINPAKQGAYVPGSGHPIVAPAALGARGVAHVLPMNPNYGSEIRATLDALGSHATLIDWSPACN